MKRILLSSGVVLAVAAVVVGATGAFFSDSAVSQNNTFSAGSLDLVLSDNNETDLGTINASFGGINLAPGSVIPQQTMSVKNAGTISGNHLDLVVTLPTGNFSDLASSTYLTSAGNGTRFGPTVANSVNLVSVLLGGSDTDYIVTKSDGVTVSAITATDIDTNLDSKISLQELATFGVVYKIRITSGTQTAGIAANTTGILWFNSAVDTTLTTQGETVQANFNWTLSQDASQL